MNKSAPALLAALISVAFLVPVAALAGSAQAASTQGSAPVEARIRAQNALFEDYYESDLKGASRARDRVWRLSLQRPAGRGGARGHRTERKSDEHHLGELSAAASVA
jgi:hypothetical protein